MHKSSVLIVLALMGCQQPASDKANSPTTSPTVAMSESAQPIPPSFAPSPSAIPSLKPTPSKTAAWPQFEAIGTEPFWNVRVRAGQVHFTTPENGGVDIDVTHSKEGKADVLTGNLWSFPFILRVKPGKCSDGMSDTVYNLTATLTILERTNNGCARLK